jgi:ribosome biogenesis protein Nip4
MDITRTRLKEIILEELSKKDKDEIKKMITKEVEDMFKSKEVKDDMGEIAKKVIKKLYRDLSLQHPYIIDRIKV